MRYRIDPTRSTAAEVRRAIGEQLCAAARKLRTPDGPDARAIHAARKHIKKARSGLRLARADLGKGLVHRLQGELREIADDLAGMRDADSQVEVADHLAASTDDPDEGDAIMSLRRVLVARADSAHEALTDDHRSAAEAARTLRLTSLWLARVPPRVEGWDALEKGLVRQYEGGRKAFERLGKDPDLDQLHDWRKRAKDLWYHARLLSDLWPDLENAVASSAHHLANLLGTDHDLGLLVTALAAGDFDDDLGDDGRDLVSDAIERERARLQAAARREGARLFVDDVETWTQRHRAWWVIALEAATQEPGVDERDRVALGL